MAELGGPARDAGDDPQVGWPAGVSAQRASTTRRPAPPSRGTTPAASSTGCPAAAGSTSPTRRSTATPRARRAPARRLPLARPRRLGHRGHLRGAGAAHRTASPTSCATSASARATGCSRCSAACPSCTSPCSARSRTPSVLLPAVLGVRARTDPPAAGPRRRPGAGHHAGAVPPEGGRHPRRSSPGSSTCCWSAADGATASTAPVEPRRRCWRRRRTEFEIPPTDPEDMALLHFTSGTTGAPKGAVHVHDAVVAHHATGATALDLHPDDVFWCTADPGWVTGTSYGIIAPLTHGVTSIVDERDFDAERWYRILAGPAGDRLVHGADRRAHADAGRRRAGPRVRPVSGCGSSPASASRSTPRPSCGASEAFGLPIHDNWWQTETGGIMIANLAGVEVRPGLDGPAAARRRGGHPGPRSPTDGPPSAATARSSRRPTRASTASWPCGPAGRRCSAATSHDDERYRRLLRRRLVPHRRPRPPRRRRLLLVRRPGRRRHQVGRPPDRTVRGRERADGAPRRRRGRRDRQARPGRRRGGQGVRQPCDPASSRPRTCGSSCSASPAAGSAPAVAPREIAFDAAPAHRPGAARSCAACSRPASSACPRATCRRWSASAVTGRRAAPRRRVERDHGLHLLREMLRIRRFEERCVELYSAGDDPRLPAPLHRRGGRRRRA